MNFENQINIFTVTEFIAHLNLALSDFGMVRIQGEVEDVSLRENYGFFNLKESAAGREGETAISCFIGRNTLQAVRHFLQSGIEVVISGYIKVYPKNGSLRLDVLSVEPLGEGALEKAFLALRAKLEQEGYFRAERKRALPEFVRRIGLVTSVSGAAIVDFQKNLSAQGLFISTVDTLVEGNLAERSLVRAIEKLQAPTLNLDLIVIIRGGGSLQSLQAFNSPLVAGAIYASRLPVITGIGHERDTTIADLVADVRCSTPTAVAVFLSEHRHTLQVRLDECVESLLASTQQLLESVQDTVESTSQELCTQTAVHIQHTKSRVRNSSQRLEANLQSFFHRFRLLEQRLHSLAQITWEKIKQKQALSTHLEKRLQELDPKAVLKRGYSLVYNSRGQIITRVGSVQPGEVITTELYQGKIQSTVN